ncbi:MAG: alpha/beta hydrolase [Gemmatimonadota bacterium]
MSAISSSGTCLVPGPAGNLEAIYRGGIDSTARAALVCHPHPQHGGTMHNKVVYRAAKAFERMGWPVLRFNFRGVGASEGAFAGGIGEADDVAAAIDWLAGQHPSARLIIAGFSFGNTVGLPVGARDPRVTHLVGIGTPTGSFDFDALAGATQPKLFVQGDRDEHGPIDELRKGLERVAEPWQLVVVENAGHFFEGRLTELQEAIVDFFS